MFHLQALEENPFSYLFPILEAAHILWLWLPSHNCMLQQYKQYKIKIFKKSSKEVGKEVYNVLNFSVHLLPHCIELTPFPCTWLCNGNLSSRVLITTIQDGHLSSVQLQNIRRKTLISSAITGIYPNSNQVSLRGWGITE